MKNNDIEKLKPYLLEYLQIKGINARPGQHINCFSPDHDDNDKSCMVDNYNFICTECGIMGNILDAINILEKNTLGGKKNHLKAVIAEIKVKMNVED